MQHCIKFIAIFFSLSLNSIIYAMEPSRKVAEDNLSSCIHIPDDPQNQLLCSMITAIRSDDNKNYRKMY